MKVRIITDPTVTIPFSGVNIVIDVLRAFTVAHIAVQKRPRSIILVGTEAEAFGLRKSFDRCLLVGERNGYPIKGFDLGNSPYDISQANLMDRIIVLKTTNGVQAVLNALDASHLFVCGFVNAAATASFVKKLVYEKPVLGVNLIPSCKTGTEDFACADYIKDKLLGSSSISANYVRKQILKSSAASKFLSSDRAEFPREDLDLCAQEDSDPRILSVQKGEMVSIQEIRDDIS